MLRLAFPSFYNTYNKSCCKLYPAGCYNLLDSTGYVCDSLKGRVTITESDGWIQFKISNVRFEDGGYYRCYVLGTQNRVYSDYYVEVSGKQSYNLHSCDVINVYYGIASNAQAKTGLLQLHKINVFLQKDI